MLDRFKEITKNVEKSIAFEMKACALWHSAKKGRKNAKKRTYMSVKSKKARSR